MCKNLFIYLLNNKNKGCNSKTFTIEQLKSQGNTIFNFQLVKNQVLEESAPYFTIMMDINTGLYA